MCPTMLNCMVELASPTELDAVFRALGDPTRRSMLRALAERERSVTELAEPHAMSLAGAAKHVKVLESAGLVRRTRSGRSNLIRLDTRRLEAAHRWLGEYQRFWNTRLDALESSITRGSRS